MLGNVLTRRAALLGFGAFAAGALSGCNTTPSAGIEPMAASGAGAIDVDTTPLVAYVGNPTAGWAQQALPAALARVLGPGAPGGLHVRIDTLYLGNGGPADPDRMRGVAILGGRTIKRARDLDLLAEPDRSGSPGTGVAGPGAGAVGRLRLPVEAQNTGVDPRPSCRAASSLRQRLRVAAALALVFLIVPCARLVLTALAAASLRWACG